MSKNILLIEEEDKGGAKGEESRSIEIICGCVCTYSVCIIWSKLIKIYSHLHNEPYYLNQIELFDFLTIFN